MSSTDTSNIFQNSYNDLQSEISSQESPSIVFGSSEIKVDKLQAKPVKVIKKTKLFNFKYKKEDESYKDQNTSEQIQYILDNEKAIKAEEDDEINIKKKEEKDELDSIKKEEKEELESEKDEQEYQKKLNNLSKDKSKEINIEETSSNYQDETETTETNEFSNSEIIDVVNSYDSEPIDRNKLADISHYEPDYGTDTDNTPQDTDSDYVPEKKKDRTIDPDQGLSFSDKWDAQVRAFKRSSGGTGGSSIESDDKKTPYVQKMQAKYDNFIKKEEKDINGIDTILGFFTIITDSISTIAESILFYCKSAIKYVKGDTRWNTGIGRIFTIFILGVVFYIILKYLF
jgi:hypothetical protein